MPLDLNFFDMFHCRVRGRGSLRDYLEEYYGAFAQSNSRVGRPDLVCEVGCVPYEAERVLGDPKSHYGRDDNAFIIKDYGGKLAIADDQWTELYCSPELPSQIARTVIEGELRKHLVEEGYSLVHASAVRYDDHTFVFPAWRHTGKTNTMLGFLQRGASYLSDDRVWVGRDGSIMGYPLPIKMLQYNFNSFPATQQSDVLTTLRGEISNRLDRFLRDKNMRIFKGLDLINQLWVKQRKTFAIEELFPNADFVESSTVDRLVALQTTTSSRDVLDFGPFGTDEATSFLSGINYHEWDQELAEIGCAYDILFPATPSKRDEASELAESDENIFREFCSNVDSFRLQVPREDNWVDEGISDSVVETVTRSTST